MRGVGTGFVTGVDVSQWQDGLRLSRAAEAGHRFAIVRACDGTYPDPVFASHVADARASGLVVGAYWYVRHPREGTSFRQQARVVAGQLGSVYGSLLDDAPAVWLDVETAPHRLDADDVAGAARALDEVGVRCAGIYTTRSYWRLRSFPDICGGLWLAQWPDDVRVVSEVGDDRGDGAAGYPGDDHRAWRPFRGRTPDLWQFTDRGSVAGFDVDVNAFRGDVDDLKRLLA
ncbi:glycoside hydrolase family 25 protein [Corynebacterium freneyi]|uniref:glycoside hydrolase family 25 protein n=1 Tax=Corynebacterium freneyi TaxID=134034 RepID=UPI001EF2742D|nr:glycoside hydrolase family 25 protein [Corynebacterium freneyi]MCG7437888.1 glycoside hydrolase family 25 protein [Corynebacterium freneyi]